MAGRILLMGIVVLAGCSSGAQDLDPGFADPLVTPDAAPGAVDPDASQELFRTFAEQSYCPRLKKCLPGLFATRHGDLASCVEAVTQELTVLPATPGVVPYAPVELRQCLAGYSALVRNCDGLLRFMSYKHVRLPACRLGTLQPGDPCTADLQCASGRCHRPLPDDACGSCATLAGHGEHCTRHDQCEQELVCLDQICSEPTLPGNGCTADAQCFPFTCIAGTCQRYRRAEHFCSGPNDCRPGDWYNSKAVQCSAATLAGEGQRCGQLQAGGWADCGAHLVCSLQGVCERRPGPGEACVANEAAAPHASVCQRPHRCIDGTCQLPQPGQCPAWSSSTERPPAITGDPRTWRPTGDGVADYDLTPDFATLLKGKPTGHIRSRQPQATSFAALAGSLNAGTYRGKRLRMTARVQAREITGSAGLWLRLDGAWGELLGIDNMQDRPIRGTSDFARHEIVVDVPAGTREILFGAYLQGDGELWVGEATFEVVDSSVPTTKP